ncbi:hypothetical protein JG688_00014888 [Phytophthora aleatoria]|uniref:RxLR effector protein n=1 Tax=Phytophthora aleatoria TaxID=2496075 RepID=A0A8J5IUG6_9STRA|nr:hypothetical protein JG688_00014888 [Phytophthora aleatoria]
MKRFFIFVVLTVAFLAIDEAVGTAGDRHHKLNDNPDQRFLRTMGTTGDDATTEERGIQTSAFDKLGKAATKLPMPQKLKFWIWKKADWNYSRLLKQFFNGVPKEVYERDPRFKVLLKYGEYMRSQL